MDLCVSDFSDEPWLFNGSFYFLSLWVFMGSGIFLLISLVLLSLYVAVN